MKQFHFLMNFWIFNVTAVSSYNYGTNELSLLRAFSIAEWLISHRQCNLGKICEYTNVAFGNKERSSSRIKRMFKRRSPKGTCRQHVTLAGLEVPHAVATSESNQRQGTSEDFFCPAIREKPLVCLSRAEIPRKNFGPEQMHASQ